MPCTNDFEGTVSGVTSDNWHHSARETTSGRFDHDSDATVSEPELEDKDKYTREIDSSTIGDHDLDATISGPEFEDKAKYKREVDPSTIVDYDSDATISDLELEEKNQYSEEIDSPTILDYDSDPTTSDPELEDEYPYELEPTFSMNPEVGDNNTVTNRKRLTPQHCSLCKQQGHIRTGCPIISCTYQGCNEIGHIRKNCPKRQKFRRK